MQGMNEHDPYGRDAQVTAHIAAEVLHEFGHGGYRPGDFRTALYTTIVRADPQNRARLALAFPAEVRAVGWAQNDPGGIDRLQRLLGGEETDG